MQRGKGRVWILPGSKATSTVEVTLSLQRGTGVLQVEKSGKGILAMFIYCRGANRVGKVTNSGVDWDTVNERRPRGDRGEAVDLRDTGGGRDFSPLRNSPKTPLSKVITGLLIHITKVLFSTCSA